MEVLISILLASLLQTGSKSASLPWSRGRGGGEEQEEVWRRWSGLWIQISVLSDLPVPGRPSQDIVFQRLQRKQEMFIHPDETNDFSQILPSTTSVDINTKNCQLGLLTSSAATSFSSSFSSGLSSSFFSSSAKIKTCRQ